MKRSVSYFKMTPRYKFDVDCVMCVNVLRVFFSMFLIFFTYLHHFCSESSEIFIMNILFSTKFDFDFQILQLVKLISTAPRTKTATIKKNKEKKTKITHRSSNKIPTKQTNRLINVPRNNIECTSNRNESLKIFFT